MRENYRRSTPKERQFIKENIGKMTNKELAEALNIRVDQVRNIYRRMGIRRIEGDGRFKPGQKPFNKGLKQTEFMSKEAIDKTKATRFKKGNTPHNTAEIGDEAITKDGYIKVKIGNPNEWIFKQRLVFQTFHNTELSTDDVIVFIDGNPLNFTPGNLQKITRQQLIEKNRIHQWPPELQEVIKLNNKLIRQIKKIENGKK